MMTMMMMIDGKEMVVVKIRANISCSGSRGPVLRHLSGEVPTVGIAVGTAGLFVESMRQVHAQ